MTFSDLIFESYMSIYDAIKDYNDYSFQFKTETIKAMTSLNLLTHNLDRSNKDDLKFCKAITMFDYNKAISGMKYIDGEEFSDVHKEYYNREGTAALCCLKKLNNSTN